jgi:hypothetical protein
MRFLLLPVLTVALLSAPLLAGCRSSGSTSTPAPTSTASQVSPATAPSSAGAVSETCPSAAVVTSAFGTTYPAPKSSSSDGTLTCNYSDPSTSANLVIVFSKEAGLSAAVLKTVADSQASAQNVTARPISGFGDAAYTFTLNDASTNAAGIATTIMLIQVGTTLLDLTAEATPAHVQALARVIVTR